MGTSTDAILVYGIPLEEGAIRYDENAKSGPSYMYYTGGVEDGVEIVMHCSAEYPMHIVAIPGTAISAYRGSPTPVAVDSLLPGTEADNELLLAFLKKHKLKKSKGAKPGWWLCSYWG